MLKVLCNQTLKSVKHVIYFFIYSLDSSEFIMKNAIIASNNLFSFCNVKYYTYYDDQYSNLLIFSMQKNAPWLSVPQFGEWDQKGPLPDYSMDFSKIREMRKQNKTNASRASLGNEEEFAAPTQKNVKADHSEPQHPHYHKTNSAVVRFCSTLLFLIYLYSSIMGCQHGYLL
jgi:hypothetical protein